MLAELMMELAESMGFDCTARHRRLPAGHRQVHIEVKEAVEREKGILTEVDSYDRIAFLTMSNGGGARTATLAGSILAR